MKKIVVQSSRDFYDEVSQGFLIQRRDAQSVFRGGFRVVPRAAVLGLVLVARGKTGYSGDAPSPIEGHLARALSAPATLDFNQAPLEKVMDHLRRSLRINVVIDEAALDDVGLAPDVPVTVHLRRAMLAEALTLMLHELDLTWRQSGEILEITRPEESESRLATVLYDVRDLAPPRAASPRCSMQALRSLLLRTIAPDTWDDVGGPGATDTFQGILVVSQTDEIHREIESLLAELRRVKAGRPAPPDLLETALNQIFTLSFRERPLHELAQALLDETKLDVVIDEKALDDVGMSNEQPVTGDLSNAPLGAALVTLLDPLDLTWRRTSNTLVLTTTEEAEARLTTRIYDVRGMLPGWSNAGGEIRAYRRLMDRIEADVAPGTWDDVGGPASITPFDGMLLVSQTDILHDQVRTNLADGAARLQIAANATAARSVEPRSWRLPADGRLAANAWPRVTCDFREMPLDEALRQLQAQSIIPILLHKKEIGEVGYDVRRGVSLQLSDTPLDAAMHYTLRRGHLGWYLRDGAMHVTTREAADAASLATQRYFVADLLNRNGRSTPASELIELLTSLIEPETWEYAGGYASIREDAGVLVITQTQRAHWHTAAVLNALRAIPPSPP